jgi:hypothetical protein
MYYTIPEGSFSEFSSATSRDLARATSGAIDQIWDFIKSRDSSISNSERRVYDCNG